MAKKVPIELTLNGEEKAEFIESGTTLLMALREKFGDTSVKGGCHQGTCGACSVLVDGELRLSCLTLGGNLRRRQSVETTGGPLPGTASCILCSAPSWTASPLNAASARPA